MVVRKDHRRGVHRQSLLDHLARIDRGLASLQRPRAAATESRLASVMQQVLRLAEETDANPATRLARLQAERDRIDAEIAQVQRGGVQTLPQDRALERAREIISQAEELTADFRNVRDAFDRLNRNLRQSLVEGASERSTVLQQLFDGVDVIEQSEPGRAFAAFWLLLTDVEQSHLLGEAISAITSRDFSRGLEPRERQFLQTLTVLLLREGNTVHRVLQQFARGLKTFVKSREFREQRRITTLMREAHAAAMAELVLTAAVMAVESVPEHLVAGTTRCMEMAHHVDDRLLDHRMVVLSAFVVLALDEGALIPIVQIDVFHPLDCDTPLLGRLEQLHDRLIKLVEVAFDRRGCAAVGHGRSLEASQRQLATSGRRGR